MITEEVATKVCSKCRSLKCVTEFSRRAASKDGLQAWCKLCSTGNKTGWIKQNRDKTFANRLWNRHRLRLPDLIAMLESQGGRCEMCPKVITIETLHIDHNHGCCPPGASCARCRRGLLCMPCNHLVGWYETMHDPARTARIVEYLSKVR
jgi:hypothetical protein